MLFSEGALARPDVINNFGGRYCTSHGCVLPMSHFSAQSQDLCCLCFQKIAASEQHSPKNPRYNDVALPAKLAGCKRAATTVDQPPVRAISARFTNKKLRRNLEFLAADPLTLECGLHPGAWRGVERVPRTPYLPPTPPPPELVEGFETKTQVDENGCEIVVRLCKRENKYVPIGRFQKDSKASCQPCCEKNTTYAKTRPGKAKLKKSV